MNGMRQTCFVRLHIDLRVARVHLADVRDAVAREYLRTKEERGVHLHVRVFASKSSSPEQIRAQKKINLSSSELYVN